METEIRFGLLGVYLLCFKDIFATFGFDSSSLDNRIYIWVSKMTPVHVYMGRITAVRE